MLNVTDLDYCINISSLNGALYGELLTPSVYHRLTLFQTSCREIKLSP